ncbi:MAG TPA: bifunctional oligoribonuclease/PAP phosphatase NrnA [Treponema sp.]|nr:bifunctional oligoribonuclease/PAP phosphatase NrnA [Treponema sp.]
MNTVPTELKKFLNDYEQYILAGHREPDGDSVGSTLALASFLKRRGKKTITLSSGPFKRPEVKKYESQFLSRLPESTNTENTAVVVLDCANIDRIGEASEGIEWFPIAIIDHHATNTDSNPVDYVIPTAPATTLLVQNVIESFNEKPTKEEAELLLFGLCTDTGFFRHLDTSFPQAFASASRLVSEGASPKETFLHMNGGKSFESRILISQVLSRMERFYDGQMIVSSETMEDTAQFGLEGRDSDSLYQLIQGISGVEVIILVRQETPDNCTVGFRSVHRVDVSLVAKHFGGGGHIRASGLSIPATIETLIPRLVAAFADQFPGVEA